MKLVVAIPLVLSFLVLGCGSSTEPSGSSPDGSLEAEASAPAADGGADASLASDASRSDGEGGACEPVGIVGPGGTIPRPTGSALRLELVYQGSAIAVREVRGVDMVIAPSVGPFEPGKNSGYWIELRDSSDRKLFTRLVRDPTRLEVPPPPDGGPFTNLLVPECTPKTILADLPNDPSATKIIVFGDGYVEPKSGARELGRFQL